MDINLANNGGIYIIFNILDCKAYVGQAKKFNNRSHISVLEEKKDNNNLQSDYDNEEKDLDFIYLAVKDCGFSPQKRTLNIYEKMYMTLMESLGFELYNKNIKKENRTLQKLGLTEDEFEKAKCEFEELFCRYFNTTPTELTKPDSTGRNDALEYYEILRLGSNKDKDKDKDIFILGKRRINEIIGTEKVDSSSINMDGMFISKAGNYIGEGLDQILYKKIDQIRKNGYCLWAFAQNAVNLETVYNCCKERAEKNLDTYVFFSFTPSSSYAHSDVYEYSFLNKNSIKIIKQLEKEQLKLLNLSQNYENFPESIKCTAASTTSTKAFVIQKFFMTDNILDKESLDKNYMAVGRYRDYDLNSSIQRSTYYIRNHNNSTDFNKSELFKEPQHRSICFVGKLMAPYVVSLKREDS